MSLPFSRRIAPHVCGLFHVIKLHVGSTLRTLKGCQTRKVKPESLQATAITETRSNFFVGEQARKEHLKAPLGEVENAVKSWTLWNIKFGDKTSRIRLRKTKISGTFSKSGKIAIENVCAHGVGSLPRHRRVVFSNIGNNFKTSWKWKIQAHEMEQCFSQQENYNDWMLQLLKLQNYDLQHLTKLENLIWNQNIWQVHKILKITLIYIMS